LKKATEEVVRALGVGENLIIYARENDIEFIKSFLEKEKNAPSSNVKFKKGEFMGGVIGMSADGSKIFYNTLESRVEALKPMLRERVASILFKR